MKVTNWCKTLRLTLLAAGIWFPGAVYAQNITLGDPSFENFVVAPPYPTGDGYAYSDLYRPTSAWVDDLDSPPGYTQDDGTSNWLYEPNYAEAGPPFRAAARTGNQAMHGLGNYNAQETGAVFEANKTYSFLIYSQGDNDSTDTTSGVFLYVFDGNIPFSDENALSGELFESGQGDFMNRGTGMTQAQSKLNWTQITLRHHVREGDPEIGHPVGVGFFGRRDAAVDDASLRADPIEDFLVYLEVNTTNGQVAIKNETGEAVHIDYYEINSDVGNSLNATAWNSLQEQDLPGFPAGDGSGDGWEEFGGVGSKVVGESNPAGNSAVPHSTTDGIELGAAYRVGFPHDLVFQYAAITGGSAAPDGDYNGDGTVDAADYVVWRKTDGNNPAGYNLWRANFGQTGGPSGPGTLIEGFVRYVSSGSGGGAAVPEPSTVLFVGIGLASLAVAGRRRTG